MAREHKLIPCAVGRMPLKGARIADGGQRIVAGHSRFSLLPSLMVLGREIKLLH